MTPIAIVGDEVFAFRKHLNASVVLCRWIFVLPVFNAKPRPLSRTEQGKYSLNMLQSAREDNRG